MTVLAHVGPIPVEELAPLLLGTGSLLVGLRLVLAGRHHG